jgi:hypothetical protein
LTFSSAVLVHGVVHAVGAGAFVWDSPAHVVMLVAALGLLAAIAVPLGLVGSRSERRRRLALVRAGLGLPSLGRTGFVLVSQAAVAASLLAAEGAVLDPERLLLALGCGLVALLCSALLFRATRERVIALLTTLVTVVADATRPPAPRRLSLRPARATVPYRLFVPNRPPPFAT